MPIFVLNKTCFSGIGRPRYSEWKHYIFSGFSELESWEGQKLIEWIRSWQWVIVAKLCSLSFSTIPYFFLIALNRCGMKTVIKNTRKTSWEDASLPKMWSGAKILMLFAECVFIKISEKKNGSEISDFYLMHFKWGYAISCGSGATWLME